MQASEQHRSSSMYHQQLQQIEAYNLPQYRTLNHQLYYNDGGQFSTPSSSELYCTLESSSATGSFTVYNSPSTVSFSPNGSPISQQDSQSYSYPPEQYHSPDNNYGSPMSGSCITDDVSSFKHKLRELESVMLGPDSDNIDSYDSAISNATNFVSLEMDSWRQTMVAISTKNLKHILIACAKAIADNDLLMGQWLMDELRQMVSVSGEPVQRLGAYMLEGLVARLSASGSSIYKALRCKEPESSELLSYMHILYEVCPYFKFGYMSANGAIAEAMKDEDRVHIIDFQIAQGSQWITLIQAFAARPGGPPHIRITGIQGRT